MSGNDRRWARAGLAGYAAAGVGVAATGFIGPSESVVTVTGVQPVLAPWIPIVAYLGLAVAVGLLLRSRPLPHASLFVVGVFLAFVATGMYEGAIRPLESSIGDLGPGFTIGRLLFWIALSSGVALVIASFSGGGEQDRWSWLGAVGFVIILAAHLTAWLGASGRLPDLTRATLSQGLWSWATQLSAWLLLFAAWQVIEGLHASADASSAAVGRVRLTWLPWALVAKLALIIIGFLYLPVATFPEWQAARVALPIGWASALVVAGAIMTAFRNPRPTVVDRSSIARGAIAVVAIWTAPFLLGLTLVALGWFVLAVIPSSIGDLIPFVLVVMVVTAMLRWARGSDPPTWPWQVATWTGLVAVAVIPPRSARWFHGVEHGLISMMATWNQVIIDFSIPWQAWALILLPFASFVWLLRASRNRPIAAALLIVGALMLPRAASVLAIDVYGFDFPTGVSPNLLMLDIALTLAIIWRLFRGRATATLRVGEGTALGVAVAIVTVLTYGSQIGSLLVDGLSRLVATVSETDLDMVSFVFYLLLPAAYALVFDAKNLNLAKSSSRIFTQLGMGCVLLVIAVVLIPLGVMSPESREDELLRTLIVPGLAVVAVVAAGTSKLEAKPENGPDPSITPWIGDDLGPPPPSVAR